ncbi:DUF637 domain-containing protein [Notoacmeibacter ruber]|uniref:DUF637 domain-containing protein n=1 Tax=Notoacmeibacter ruber TaxID=2670375 RepID=UPI001313DF0D|nr:DUF637 domain-containing protein [Notoacmeibacter ruber]
MTQAGAALVALVVSTVTSGVGGSFASGLGFAQGSIASAAMEAGFTSLATQTSISLINNQGDIGATLKELGSEDSIRTLVGAMLTAGLTQGVLNRANIPATSIELGASQNFANAAQRNLLRAAIKIGVQSAVEGRTLDDSLVSALRLAAADTLGASLATEIGRSYHTGQIDKATQLIAHAALGCATGTISSGACASGAGGAVAGELTAELFEMRLHAALAKGDLTRTAAIEMVKEWRADGVEVARVAGGLAAALAGGDVDTGAAAGGTAAENNAFWIPAVIIIAAILETADKVLVAKDAVDISVAVYACNGGDMAACGQAEDMAKQAALDAGLEFTIGGIIPGSKAAADLLRWTRKNADADTVRRIDRIADKEPTGFSGSRGNPLEQPTYQPVRNSPTSIGNRTYSGHALDQMQNRGIPPSVVEDTVSPGNLLGAGNRPNTSVYYSSKNGVRVVTNSNGDIVTVITAPRQ